MTQPITATGTKSVLHGNWLTGLKNYGPKMEHRSMNTSQDPWDQLHPMISLQNTEPNGFGNLNLRIKESHLRVVFFDSARKQKDKLSFQQLVFFYLTLKSSLPRDPSWSFLNGMVRCHQSFLQIQSTSLGCPTLHGSQGRPHLEPFHRSWSIQFLSQV